MTIASRNCWTSTDDVLVNLHLAVMIETEMTHDRTLAVGGCKTKIDLVELNGLFHSYCFILWHSLRRSLSSLGWTMSVLYFLQCCNAMKVFLHFRKNSDKLVKSWLGRWQPALLFSILHSQCKSENLILYHVSIKLCFLREEAKHNLWVTLKGLGNLLMFFG